MDETLNNETTSKRLISERKEVVAACLQELLLSEQIGIDYNLCQALYTVIKNHSSLSRNVCEVIASLARKEEFRKYAASFKDFISVIAPLLLCNDIETQIQALRAIGNLCHNEDDCRLQFLLQDGHILLTSLIKQCLVMSIDTQAKFKIVVCGCLLNFCCQNETLCQLLLDLDVIKLLALLISIEKNTDVLNMSLKALSVLLEAECCFVESLMDSFLLEGLSHVIARAIDVSGDDYMQVLELVLEIFETTLADENCILWREALVDTGTVLQLLHLTDTELASKVYNIFIQVTLSDNAMEKLFSNNELWKTVLKHARNRQLSPNLRASCISLIGNFARSDANCEDLIKQNIVFDLIGMLDEESLEETVKLNYAIMTTLRNLAIPDCSKDSFNASKVLDIIINVLNTSHDPNVLMKTVGCLRLLSKHNDISQHLTFSNSVISRVVAVCDMFSFPHIKIEGCRLLASLIKHQHLKDVVSIVIKEGGANCLLYLLKTDYSLLKNEGVIALTIAASFNLDGVVEAVLNGDSIEAFIGLLQDSSFQLIDNSLTLLQILSHQSESLKNMLCCPQLLQQLKVLSGHENKSICEKVIQLQSVIAT